MALYTGNTGELQLLDKLLRDTLSTDEDYILKLYRTDFTPSDLNDFNQASFTEANFTDYAARTLTRNNWTTSVTNGSNKAESSYATQSWTCGATGNTIYGYYVVAETSFDVLWAERFATSRVLASSDVLNLTPKFTLNRE